MRSASLHTLVTLAVAAVVAGCAQPAPETQPATEVKPGRTFALPGVRGTRPGVGVPGRIDHLAYDPATKRLFVAALENGSLEVLDLESGERVRSIGGLSRPQGAAVVPTRGSVAVACGGDGVMHVYDTRSLEQKKNVEVGPDADNVRYDTRNDTVLVSYGSTNSGAIAVFDARTWTQVREIRFDSRPESFQLELKGERVFANLPKGVRAVEDGKVAVANRRNGQVVASIPLPGRARNFPMAFDAAHERLFIASRRPARLIVIDTRRNLLIGEAPCTDDSDDLFYDAQTGRVLVIGGGFRPDLQEPGSVSPCSPPGEVGGLDVFEVGRDGEVRRLSTTPTACHARTGLFVPARRAIYVAVPFRGEREAEIREYLVP
jgi:hypothetical protein